MAETPEHVGAAPRPAAAAEAGARQGQAPRKAVFLDRDGTLVEEVHYLRSIDQLRVYAWTPAALRRLSEAGFALVVVTNQAAVARGIIDEAFVQHTHDVLVSRLAPEGVRFEAIYYCPHHPDGVVDAYRVVCECRKPSPGLLLRAAGEHNLDLSSSFVIGDRWLDVELAERAGARGILVKTGHGTRETEAPKPSHVNPAAIVETLLEAAEWIVREDEQTTNHGSTI